MGSEQVPTTSKFHPPKYKLTQTGNIHHESALILEKDDMMMCDFKISAPDGDGWLVITHWRAYVVLKKGVHLFPDWRQVNDFKIKGNNITIIWHEDYMHRYDYTIKILNNKIGDVEKMFLVHCNLNEARSVPIPAEERDMIRRGRIENQRNKVLALEEEMAELRKKFAVLVNEFEVKNPYDIIAGLTETELEIKRAIFNDPGIASKPEPKKEIEAYLEMDVETSQAEKIQMYLEKEMELDSKREKHPYHHGAKGSWSQSGSAYVSEGGAILKRITEIESVMELERINLYFVSFDTIQRSPLIPPEIESRDAWYDAYYDAKHDAYVHVGDFQPSLPYLKKARKDTNLQHGCGFTPWPANKIETVLGQPAFVHSYKSLQIMETAWLSASKIGIENYHYMRCMGEHSIQLHGKYVYQIVPNSSWNGSNPKEYIRICMRLGLLPGWAQPTNSTLGAEVLEEEKQLAKEGNVNYMSLALEDTPYADSEDISRIPHIDTIKGQIGLEPCLFER